MNRRDCQEVILKMIKKIPHDKIDFIKDLQWNFEDAGYKAPGEVLQWHRTMETLQKHIPKPIAKWEFKVLSIFTTRTMNEQKKTIIKMSAMKQISLKDFDKKQEKCPYDGNKFFLEYGKKGKYPSSIKCTFCLRCFDFNDRDAFVEVLSL